MIIQKFGGSNFISKEVFENFYEILRKTEGSTIVVISALGKTTRRLLDAAKQAENGNMGESLSISEKLRNFTVRLAELIMEDKIILESALPEVNFQFDQVDKYLKNIGILSELTPRVLDSLLSFGERISLTIFSNFCKSKSLKFTAIDAGEIIITDEEYNSANPLTEKIKQNINTKILPLLNSPTIILTQGFIGKTAKGDYSTMGFESSNLTALLFAENLSAREITIWTDVEGIYNIDPHIWQKAEQLSEMSFREAKKAAKYGNKLIYPRMLESASGSNMEITYRSIHNPKGKSTKLFSNSDSKSKMINVVDDISFFRMNLNSNDEPTAQIFRKLTHKNDYFKFVSRFNDLAEVFTNDEEIELILKNSEIPYDRYICLTLINENILSLYKLIGNYSDLFLNADSKLFPIEQNIYLLFIRKQNSRDFSNILSVILQ